MKKLGIILVIFFGFFGELNAYDFSKMASGKPTLVQEGKAKKWCRVCGMSLKMFYKTSHIAHAKDGKAIQYCSLRCLIDDHIKYDTDLNKAMVVDVISEKFIPAQDAFYVVGSKVLGTMSKVSKLAFASKKEAQHFIKKMGGEIKTFKQAYEIAHKSLKKDRTMTSKKREKMMYPMGKKILKAKCEKGKINPLKYHHINELKPEIKQNCKNLNPKQIQAVALYLWDVVKGKNHQKNHKLHIKDDEKCPVCGMFVGKYPRWAAQIIHSKGHLSFDGVKDLAKYLQNPAKYGTKADFKANKVIVTDYYTQLAIDGKKAFYVIGSDVLGPMGHELIPFEKKNDAKTFLQDHKGSKIINLKDINPSMLCKLDGKECE
ncbi:MAG: nitrous oxide reductase [Proteobacteria bacterium]|nr:MAG: nitrous oxide reductase [Pseudomonadota bacterium]